jgi:hypothetical protein
MTEESKQKDASRMQKFKKLFSPNSPDPDPNITGKDTSTPPPQFRWFTLITIPDARGNTPERFNEQIAEYVNKELRNKGTISFLELYLTEEVMQRLYNEMSFDGNRQALLRAVNAQLPSSSIERGQDKLRVGLFFDGLLITPALQHLFSGAFIARHIIPPHVYIPIDDSKISPDVKQYLIGELEVENQYGTRLGSTPIRALLQQEKLLDNSFRVSAHADFDLVLKAFANKEFSAYPLGINITCTIKEEMGSRPIQRVNFDIHDTRLLERWSINNAQTQFSYNLISGRNVVTDINDFQGDIVPVEDFTSNPEYSRAVARSFPVPVNRRMGVKVVLKHTISDEDGTRGDIATYKFLFRFFESALSYSAGVNKLQGLGQFVRRHGETTVMLPPLSRDGRTEAQFPALIISHQTKDKEQVLKIRKHPDSDLNLRIGGNPLTIEGVELPLKDSIKIEAANQQGNGNADKISFVVQPLDKVSAERNSVANQRSDRNYVAFIEVNSDRAISLTLKEIILGRGHFLDRNSGVTTTALTLKRPLIQWEMAAGEEVLYYSTNFGSVVTPLTKIEGTVPLDLVGTYYVYVGDFEFMIYLESTPRTELVLKGR